MTLAYSKIACVLWNSTSHGGRILCCMKRSSDGRVSEEVEMTRCSCGEGVEKREGGVGIEEEGVDKKKGSVGKGEGGVRMGKIGVKRSKGAMRAKERFFSLRSLLQSGDEERRRRRTFTGEFLFIHSSSLHFMIRLLINHLFNIK